MAYYVEKIRVPVRLVRDGAEALSGIVSLAPRAELHDGPETLLECVNAAPRVLPLLLEESERVLLVARDRIDWIEPMPGVEDQLVRPRPYMPTREEFVRVRLASGEELEGILSMEMPHEFNRVSDYLNADDHFFPLHLESGVRLLNKHALVEVQVRTIVPVPRAA
jgi:hypothetical protein